jgi:hypothetical protein
MSPPDKYQGDTRNSAYLGARDALKIIPVIVTAGLVPAIHVFLV